MSCSRIFCCEERKGGGYLCRTDVRYSWLYYTTQIVNGHFKRHFSDVWPLKWFTMGLTVTHTCTHHPPATHLLTNIHTCVHTPIYRTFIHPVIDTFIHPSIRSYSSIHPFNHHSSTYSATQSSIHPRRCRPCEGTANWSSGAVMTRCLNQGYLNTCYTS